MSSWRNAEQLQPSRWRSLLIRGRSAEIISRRFKKFREPNESGTWDDAVEVAQS